MPPELEFHAFALHTPHQFYLAVASQSQVISVNFLISVIVSIYFFK